MFSGQWGEEDEKRTDKEREEKKEKQKKGEERRGEINGDNRIRYRTFGKAVSI